MPSVPITTSRPSLKMPTDFSPGLCRKRRFWATAVVMYWLFVAV